MNGSEPPSSTVFFSNTPAFAATLLPGDIAAREGDSHNAGILDDPIDILLSNTNVRKMLSGRPREDSPMARAQPLLGTLEDNGVSPSRLDGATERLPIRKVLGMIRHHAKRLNET